LGRVLALVYGAVAYVAFLAAFLYAIGWVNDVAVPRGIDDPGKEGGPPLLVDALLLGAFAIQHSVMARPAFKRWWTRVVPPPVERSTFVLLASLLLGLVYWQWRAMPEPVWRVDGEALRAAIFALGGIGWVVVLVSTFLIDYFDLFGLRQVWLHFRGRPYAPPPFRTVGFYRWVRHPIMLGFLVAFWATPDMTRGHLLFAGLVTAYVLVAIRLEERDLARSHDERYLEYRRRVGMLLPRPSRR
jgi:protein-S-isoprenylcysteine O-methyltransferase Ste14